MKNIEIRGARTHNLQNIDVDLPRDKLIVITGLSGSGKSSLAFEMDRENVAEGAFAKMLTESFDKKDDEKEEKDA